MKSAEEEYEFTLRRQAFGSAVYHHYLRHPAWNTYSMSDPCRMARGEELPSCWYGLTTT